VKLTQAERKWKLAQAKKLAAGVVRHFERKVALVIENARKDEERRRRIAGEKHFIVSS
jgi:hypothetical protein